MGVSLAVLEHALEEFINDLDYVIPNKIGCMAAVIVRDDLQGVFDKCVDNFYETYLPIYYIRTEGLKTAYRISVNGPCVDWEMGAELMTGNYRVNKKDDKYIYNHVFVEGWHGGAMNGEGHPEPGTPYWRTPHPSQTTGKPWVNWGAAASSSLSAYKMIKNELSVYENSEIITDILNSCQKKVVSSYLLYRLFN